MPFCPSCKYEYVPGIKECPDCRVKLVDHLNAEPEPEQYEWADLVTVADFMFDVEAQAAKLKLESFGIPSVLSNDIISRMDIGISAASGGVHLMVNRPDVRRAHAVLAEAT